MPPLHNLHLITSDGFPDYALLDSGLGRKLERFGKIVVDRPEPQALWQPKLGKSEWAKANAVFSASGEDDEKGKWRIDKPVPDAWPVRLALPRSPKSDNAKGGTHGVTMLCKLAGLWHLGLFPEQEPHWRWMLDHLASVKGETPRVLNLFGYTGAASLLAAEAGAEVTHVDASKKAIQWGKENQEASKLGAAKIRWLLDDAAKFAARDVRRGKTYHMIIVDPPKFGRGPEGEIWDLFQNLPALLGDLAKLLAPQNAAMVLTIYAIRASSLAFDQLMRERLHGRSGEFDSGELAIRSGAGPLVPTSLFVRWKQNA
ncbi:class I SAM-dependent methyltransferase [Hyphomicrobium facile]|uniref:23S rRNA (Cytosine1962-C5)-methyltransferase n=1 Tax=Hyphomicrobium facile TaxID=51670 RepID=A0A1I7NJQ1_9HYPH|nr:class I SAM-dependent methyltransferase [Hyphomicrobium facile]SFV34776.1 23S rRNA (cytosine1962-C5)-methyltransferase [Hyphomicrobium facile]